MGPYRELWGPIGNFNFPYRGFWKATDEEEDNKQQEQAAGSHHQPLRALGASYFLLYGYTTARD